MSVEKRIRVLVAEDSQPIRHMTKLLLEEIGYTVIGEAVNGREAVERTEALRPDVVLMDIEMPDIDGIEAARRIHARCPTPVVVLTAYEMPELVVEASAAGVGAYLAKPPDPGEIERAIVVAMARFDDMMELQRLNTQLVRLNRELRAQNEELNAFAHTVAHDLKSPLNMAAGYVELLSDQDSELSDIERLRYLARVLSAVQRMDNIIDELLLFAEVRRQDVRIEPLAMSVVVKRALQRIAHEVEQYRAQLTVPESWPVARGYAPWIEEVWVNYISNAIKYGGQPPRIVLGADEAQDGMVRFWVKDNGSGISRDEQARLFNAFTRLGDVRVEGHGLGLSIVRRIVERLGGQVGVESTTGRGSTFSFTLPVEMA